MSYASSVTGKPAIPTSDLPKPPSVKKSKAAAVSPTVQSRCQDIARDKMGNSGSNSEIYPSVDKISISELLQHLIERIHPNGIAENVLKKAAKKFIVTEKKQITEAAPDLLQDLKDLERNLGEIIETASKSYGLVEEALKDQNLANEGNFTDFSSDLIKQRKILQSKNDEITNIKKDYERTIILFNERIRKCESNPLTNEEIINNSNAIGVDKVIFERSLKETKNKKDKFLEQRNNLVLAWTQILKMQWIITDQLNLTDVALDLLPEIKQHIKKTEEFSQLSKRLFEETNKSSMDALRVGNEEIINWSVLQEKHTELKIIFEELERDSATFREKVKEKLSCMKVLEEEIDLKKNFFQEIDQFEHANNQSVKEEIILVQRKHNDDRILLRKELIEDWNSILLKNNFLKDQLKFIHQIIFFIPNQAHLENSLSNLVQTMRDFRIKNKLNHKPEKVLIEKKMQEAAKEYHPLCLIYKEIEAILKQWEPTKNDQGDFSKRQLIAEVDFIKEENVEKKLQMDSKELYKMLVSNIEKLITASEVAHATLKSKFKETALEFELAQQAHKTGKYPTKSYLGAWDWVGFSNLPTLNPTEQGFDINKPGYFSKLGDSPKLK